MDIIKQLTDETTEPKYSMLYTIEIQAAKHDSVKMYCHSKGMLTKDNVHRMVQKATDGELYTPPKRNLLEKVIERVNCKLLLLGQV